MFIPSDVRVGLISLNGRKWCHRVHLILNILIHLGIQRNATILYLYIYIYIYIKEYYNSTMIF